MKKKIFTLVLTLVLGLTIVGCGSNSTTNNVVNNIENNITNKVVEYEDIKITDLENAVEEAVKRVENAVVGVVLKQVSTIGSATSEDNYSTGSGVVYKAVENYEGTRLTGYTYYAITNRHVVVADEGEISSGNKTKIFVYLGFEDLELEANLIAYDSKVDLACISFVSNCFIQPVQFADSDTIQKGSFVIAIGNPEGFDYYGSVTFGVVSGPLRYISADTDNDGTNDFYGKYIQHDASINPGNSGGGLFTLDGKLVGINTLKISSSSVDNMGFAIPSNEVKLIVTEYLEKNIEIKRPLLGITGTQVRDLTPAAISSLKLKDIPESIYEAGEAPYGIYVRSVSSGGSLSKSGVAEDDIILKFDGIKLKTMSSLSAMLNTITDYPVGSKVKITYYDRSAGLVKEIEVELKAQ